MTAPPRRARSGRAPPRDRFRCHACGVSTPYEARAYRHADEARHHRIEVILR